jgi:ABC-type multidrug transport system fused ATPase/permease subunit
MSTFFKMIKSKRKINPGFKSAFSVLEKSDRKKLYLVTLVQVLLSFLDLAGVAVIGVLGALTVSGVQSAEPGNRINAVLSLLRIEDLTFQTQATILGIAAVVLLLLRTLFSMYFLKRTLFFLSRRSAVISTILVSKFLSQDVTELNSKSEAEYKFALTSGVSTITNGIVGTLVAIVSDVSILLVLTIGLLVVDTPLAIITISVLGSFALLIYRYTKNTALNLGLETASMTISSHEVIQEIIRSYREVVVRNQRQNYIDQISKMRFNLSHAEAELNFLPNLSKYVIEAVVIVGGFALGAYQFAVQDAVHGVATLSVFLAAGTRIAPAMLRLQQGALTIRSSLGNAIPTLELINILQTLSPLKNNDRTNQGSNFDPQIIMKDLSYAYPLSTKFAISNISLSIKPKEMLAIVGPSGAGKTTLVDLCLGVLQPTSGSIYISNSLPLQAFSNWPGKTAYVPQEIFLSQTTILENILAGRPLVEKDLEQAIEMAQLNSFLDTLEDGVHTSLQESGTNISGGQKQRIGIARAIYSRPEILVLDEATSALDNTTQDALSAALNSLKDSTTIIVIAHRLSTIKEASRIVYMEEGKIISVGTFEELKKMHPQIIGESLHGVE